MITSFFYLRWRCIVKIKSRLEWVRWVNRSKVCVNMSRMTVWVSSIHSRTFGVCKKDFFTKVEDARLQEIRSDFEPSRNFFLRWRIHCIFFWGVTDPRARWDLKTRYKWAIFYSRIEWTILAIKYIQRACVSRAKEREKKNDSAVSSMR